jgi:hypothetical protein
VRLPVSLSAYFYGGTTITEQADLRAAGAVAFSKGMQIPIARYDFTPTTFFAGPVPIVVTHTLTFFIDADLNITARLDYQVQQVASVTAGLEYSGRLTPIFSKSFSCTDTFDFFGDLTASSMVGTRWESKLYGAIGPFLQLRAGIRLSAALASAPNAFSWRLDACTDGRAGLTDSFKIFSSALDPVSFSLFEGCSLLRQGQLEAPTAATITRFTAAPETITAGESSTLSWDVAGTSPIALAIDQGVGDVSGQTSVIVSPTATTTYTLTATNSVGSDSKQVTVTVVPHPVAPTIARFSAEPSTIAAGESATLSWDVAGTSPIALAIDQGVGDVSGQTSVIVSPTATTTYTLTATNSVGSDSKQVTVTVLQPQPPDIMSFTAAPSAITAGESSTLSWDVTGTAPIALAIDQGVGDVSGQTSVIVSPSATTTYTLTATSSVGGDSKQVTVTVTPVSPGSAIGRVVSAADAAPIGGATVSFGGNRTTTAADGSFSISLPAGTYTATASASGFASVSISNVVITSGETTDLGTIRLSPEAPPPPAWTIQTVDSDVQVEFGTSLALDSQGRPHISYDRPYEMFSTKFADLWYARFDGTRWNTEYVTVEGYVGLTSLALDRQNRPHIGYYDWKSRDLMYAQAEGTEWYAYEIVDEEGNVGDHPSLALDSQGRPHIGYLGEFRYLKYARFDGTQWHIEIVEIVEETPEAPSLVLDSQDRPHISYYEVETGTLKYARFDGTQWHIETVEGAGVVRADLSLALDSRDRPHISYPAYGTADLKYARFDGTRWRVETVDGASASEVASLALDSRDRPHIAYEDWSNLLDIKYARFDGTSWHIETVAETGARHPSLALDQNDRPHISYYDVSDRELKYAHR